jgi:hypothetical protein
LQVICTSELLATGLVVGLGAAFALIFETKIVLRQNTAVVIAVTFLGVTMAKV